MYDLNPPHVFVHKRVHKNPKAVTRLERMLKGLRNPRIEEVEAGDTDRVIEACGAREDLPVMSSRVRQGHERRAQDSVMLFNTFVWDKNGRVPVAKKYKNVRAQAIARFSKIEGEPPNPKPRGPK